MITTINNKNYLVDVPNNRITFLDSRFYISENGLFIPSVTTILEAYPKGFGFYKWLKENGENADDIRDEAGRKGSTVHRLSENYDNGLEVSLLDEDTAIDGGLKISLTEWNWFERYVEFSTRFPHENLAIEMNVVNESLGYAGTLDRLKQIFGKRYLVDIKTGGYQDESWWLQLAAYRHLLKEIKTPVDDVAILWLNAKTRTEGRKDAVQGKGWQWLTRTAQEQEKDLKLFNHTHALWLSQNEGMTPRQISYQLKHKK